jgi:phospholipid/cholesterol/gamma-HCH transport system substrate-binding protein
LDQEEGHSPEQVARAELQPVSSGRPWLARAIAGVALLAGFVLVLIILFGGSSGRKYHLLFQNGGQLVSGNEVLVAGQKVGSVDDVKLTDDGQAEVTISVDEALHEGTTAVIRATSLSGIANRYVSITPGPNNMPELDDGATLGGDKTTSPVDLDQLFNTFTPRTRLALRDVIQGSAAVYDGHAHGARETYKYFAPGLSATRRLFTELTSDSRAFSQFLVQGSKALGAIGDRRDDLSALTQNANEFLGAIASQNAALDESLQRLPPTMRQANTTFVNLRAALDDVTPLVNDAKPATKDLAPFLRKLRPVAERSVPVFHDLRQAINRPGNTNDLTDSLRELPQIERKAARATPQTIGGLDASQPVIEFARPYMPDLMGFISKFGEVTSFYDANGHYARVSTADANIFHYCEPGDTNSHCAGGGGPYSTGQLAPIPPSEQFNDLTFGNFTRCPGGSTQPIPGSNPFTDDGNLLNGGQPPNPKCVPSDVPPGP